MSVFNGAYIVHLNVTARVCVCWDKIKTLHLSFCICFCKCNILYKLVEFIFFLTFVYVSVSFVVLLLKLNAKDNHRNKRKMTLRQGWVRKRFLIYFDTDVGNCDSFGCSRQNNMTSNRITDCDIQYNSEQTKWLWLVGTIQLHAEVFFSLYRMKHIP